MSTLKKILSNSLFLYVFTLSNYFIGLLVFPYLSRILSVESFGVVMFGMSAALVFQSIVDFGFMISATADVAKNKNNLSIIFERVSNVLFAKIILLVVCLVVFVFASFFVPIIKNNINFMIVFVLSASIYAFIPDFYFRGMEKMKYIAIRSVVSKISSIVLMVLFVGGDSDLIFVPISFFAGNVVALIWAFFDLRKDGFKLVFSEFKDVLFEIKKSFPFFLSRISATLNQSIGAFVIGNGAPNGSSELGLFSAAWRISSAVEMLLLPVSDSIYPHMMNKRDYKFFWMIYVRGIFVWLFICAFVFFFSEIVCVILLGESYGVAGEYLKIMMFGVFAAFSSNMFGYNALGPIGLSFHANMAIVASLLINIFSVFLMGYFGVINAKNICMLMASSNFLIFSYRFFVFLRNRDKWSSIKNYVSS